MWSIKRTKYVIKGCGPLLRPAYAKDKMTQKKDETTSDQRIEMSGRRQDVKD
jgi:hypothetical protein